MKYRKATFELTVDGFNLERLEAHIIFTDQ
jgi:hypothetical protein